MTFNIIDIVLVLVVLASAWHGREASQNTRRRTNSFDDRNNFRRYRGNHCASGEVLNGASGTYSGSPKYGQYATQNAYSRGNRDVRQDLAELIDHVLLWKVESAGHQLARIWDTTIYLRMRQYSKSRNHCLSSGSRCSWL
jgi:hypothetical protein